MENQKLQKNEFVEIEYTGRTKQGDIFDTNIKEEAKKINLDISKSRDFDDYQKSDNKKISEVKNKPLVICLGQNMILQSIDEFLIGKEIGKDYTLELPPERAFGIRDKKLIKTIPISVFREQEVSPQPGMVFVFDNLLGKVISSGSRVIVDFNNPLAGKDVIYEIKVKRKVNDEKEKIKSLMLSFFRKEFEFEIKEKKLIIRADEKIKKFLSLYKDKFKEILDLELEVIEKK